MIDPQHKFASYPKCHLETCSLLAVYYTSFSYMGSKNLKCNQHIKPWKQQGRPVPAPAAMSCVD